MTPKEVMDKMEEIRQENPLAMEYETDASAVWPQRWAELMMWVALGGHTDGRG